MKGNNIKKDFHRKYSFDPPLQNLKKEGKRKKRGRVWKKGRKRGKIGQTLLIFKMFGIFITWPGTKISWGGEFYPFRIFNLTFTCTWTILLHWCYTEIFLLLSSYFTLAFSHISNKPTKSIWVIWNTLRLFYI